MKTLVGTLLVTAIIFITACTPKPNAQDLLKNDDMRHEIMKAICADHGMATEMVNYLTSSDASRDMMRGTCQFMQTVIARDIIKEDTAMQRMLIANTIYLLGKDSILCDKTCTQITNIPQMKRMMEKNK